jgi:hypothetical protein
MAFNCYRMIAIDLDLGKPWEEQGKEKPDSLVEVMRKVLTRAPGNPQYGKEDVSK